MVCQNPTELCKGHRENNPSVGISSPLYSKENGEGDNAGTAVKLRNFTKFDYPCLASNSQKSL